MNINDSSSVIDEVGRNRFLCYLLLAISLILFFSCNKGKCQKTSKSKKNSSLIRASKEKKLSIFSKLKDYIKSDSQAVLELEKQTDIPVPVGYELLHAQTKNLDGQADDVSMVFCYEGKLSFKQVVDFYLQNMELLGWDISDLSSGDEGMLFCSKINKTCAVSIRSEPSAKNNKKKGGVRVYLFLKKVEEALKNEAKDINAKSLILDNFSQTTGFIC